MDGFWTQLHRDDVIAHVQAVLRNLVRPLTAETFIPPYPLNDLNFGKSICDAAREARGQGDAAFGW